VRFVVQSWLGTPPLGFGEKEAVGMGLLRGDGMEGVLVSVYPPNLSLASLRTLHRLLRQNNERAKRFCRWLDRVIVREMRRRVRERRGRFVEARLPEIDFYKWSNAEVGAGLVVAAVLAEAVHDPGMSVFMRRLVFLFSVQARERLGG
jgi:hypothetical protein